MHQQIARLRATARREPPDQPPAAHRCRRRVRL